MPGHAWNGSRTGLLCCETASAALGCERVGEELKTASCGKLESEGCVLILSRCPVSPPPCGLGLGLGLPVHVRDIQGVHYQESVEVYLLIPGNRHVQGHSPQEDRLLIMELIVFKCV